MGYSGGYLGNCRVNMSIKYPILITRCSGLQRIDGNESFIQLKEVFFKGMLHEIIDKAAYDLSNAQFDCPHYLEFNLTMHAKEIKE